MEFSPIDIRNYVGTCEDRDNVPMIWDMNIPKARKHRSNVAAAVALFLESCFGCEMSIDYLVGNRTFSGKIVSDLTIHEALKVAHYFGGIEKVEFPFDTKDDEQSTELVNEFWDNLIFKGHKIRNYHHFYDFEDMKKAIELTNLPLIIGVDWYEDVEVRNGVVRSRKSGAYDGKALLIYGWNERGWKVLNPNEPEWGDNGKAILPYYYSIHECWGVLPWELERDGIFKVKKPLHSKVGNFFAKIFNKIANGLGF